MGATLGRPSPLSVFAVATVVAALVRLRALRNEGRGRKSLAASATTGTTGGRASCAPDIGANGIPPRPSRTPPGAAPANTCIPARPSRPPPGAPAPALLWGCEQPKSPAERVEEQAELWICLDFEWTCDEGEHRLVHPENGEIIEFAFAVYDAKAGKVACEGQYYIKNVKTPITDFCTNLTGISTETLKDAGSLKDALDKFNEALDTDELRGRPTCAVAHGSADLELMLPANCGAQGLQVPQVLRRYVDLREAVQTHVAKSGVTGVRASTLRQICEALKVEMLGMEHCGLDDSWMVLRSTQELLKAGADMRSVDLDFENDAFLQGKLAPAGSFQEKALCLDGIAFFAIATEVLPWLERHLGCTMHPDSSLSVVLGNDGRPTGRAVMDFGSHEIAAKALKALEGGKRISCGSKDYWPYEPPKERLVLIRPLRHKELTLLSSVSYGGLAEGPALAPFPADAHALDLVRTAGRGGGGGGGKGGGKGRVPTSVGCEGTVKVFGPDKGFGFISYSEGEVFVHMNDCQHKEALMQGDFVRFDVVEDPRNGKMKATNVKCVTN